MTDSKVQGQFETCIRGILEGKIGSYEHRARDLIKAYKLPSNELDDALKIGRERKYKAYINLARKGTPGFAREATILAEEYGFPIQALEDALIIRGQE